MTGYKNIILNFIIYSSALLWLLIYDFIKYYLYLNNINIKNFQNPYYVAKEITLNKNKEIECGYVRYYSSNLDSDKYWYEFYLKVRRLLLTTE